MTSTPAPQEQSFVKLVCYNCGWTRIDRPTGGSDSAGGRERCASCSSDKFKALPAGRLESFLAWPMAYLRGWFLRG